VIGPSVVTPDEVPDPSVLHLRATITRNGHLIFADECGVDRMKRTLPELVHFLRLNNPIQDGTVLSTGTGIIVTQDQALHEGDVVTIEASPIGALRHGMRRLPIDA
jgi:2-dehydro-3-deoxy-D-arabinonate dehydratase